jgi:hypothetical protein
LFSVLVKYKTFTKQIMSQWRSPDFFNCYCCTATADEEVGCDYIWTTIARVLSVAKDHGKISVNVCERGGRLYDADRSEIIWQASDIREFCGVASVELQAALLLALWTGQRQGDLLKLSWKSYDGTYIRLRPLVPPARSDGQSGGANTPDPKRMPPGRGSIKPEALANARCEGLSATSPSLIPI